MYPNIGGGEEILKGPCLCSFDLKVERGLCCSSIVMFAREDGAVSRDFNAWFLTLKILNILSN